jgi:hypothetical protein
VDRGYRLRDPVGLQGLWLQHVSGWGANAGGLVLKGDGRANGGTEGKSLHVVFAANPSTSPTLSSRKRFVA